MCATGVDVNHSAAPPFSEIRQTSWVPPFSPLRLHEDTADQSTTTQFGSSKADARVPARATFVTENIHIKNLEI